MRNDLEPEEHRLVIAISIAAAAGGGSGMSVAGFFGDPGYLPYQIAIATVGGVVAAFIARKELRDRLVAAVAFVVGTVSMTVVTALYIEGRHIFGYIEILIPLAISAVPALAAYFLLRALLDSLSESTRRYGTAALVTLLLAVPPVGWAVAHDVLRSEPEPEPEVRVETKLELKMDAEGNVYHDGREIPVSAVDELIGITEASGTHGEVILEVPPGLDDRSAIANIAAEAKRSDLQFSTRPTD